MSEVSSRYFNTRTQAADAARRIGHAHFQTFKQPQGWKWASMPVPSPAIGYAQGKDFVAWVETHHIDEGRTNGYRGVIVTTCSRDELPSDIPDHFEVQPITPSLWDDIADTSTRQAKATGSVQSGARAKSDVVSPVKIVWAMADKMVGADRKEVIDACVAAGVNKATASTQYYRWARASEVK